MYAIVDIAGQQFKVEKDNKIFVHRLEGKAGSKVEFDQVLLIDNGNNVTVGTPVISGAMVTGKIIDHLKGDKVLVFKKKRRKGYQKLNGHRQYMTQIVVEEIIEKGAKPKAAEKKATTAKKEEKPAAEAPKAKPAAEKKEASTTATKKATASKTTADKSKSAAEKPKSTAKKPAAKKSTAAKPKAEKATAAKSTTKKATGAAKSTTTAKKASTKKTAEKKDNKKEE
jgi:large subunit ribosomal protein L21